MKYQNPILKGFNPDPSICRAGEDYYLVTSSFEFFPGIPLYHSTDLVNWEQIGNCIEDPDLYPYEKAKISGGIWAPTIRFHEGVFYVTAKFEGFGNFIISTEDPKKGWSKPVRVALGGIDPSLLFDDDKVYFCTNQGTPDRRPGISVVEINVNTGEFLSDVRQVWEGTGGGYMESPHIYHIGEWYYLIVAEGGTGLQHMANIARSHSIWGPYEACPHNPILTNRNDATKAIACAGHADLVEDHRGNWWMVHLGTRPTFIWYSYIGRESFLMPVTWQNGWPFVGEDQKSHIEVDAPTWGLQEKTCEWTADLGKADPRWLYLRKPHVENYVREKDRFLLKPSTVQLCDPEASPTLMAVRPPDTAFSVDLKLLFQPQKDGDEAGLTLYQSCDFHYSIALKRENGNNYICVTKRACDFYQEVYRRELTDTGEIALSISASKDKFLFYDKTADGQAPAAECDTRFMCCEFVGRCFTGTLLGIYACCREETDAVAVITHFSTKTN